MDLLTKQGAQLAPKNTAEATAIFRAQVIGPLLTRVFHSHGDLASEIRALTRVHHRPPGSSTTRTYSAATIERWYYRFKKRGLAGITLHRRQPSRCRSEPRAAGLLDRARPTSRGARRLPRR